ncbi:bifunctional DNA-formamidopyrimidine glycosylase/DNA-(apurinic or apyrimidinic site) lyase [Cardiobacteriaceae bacterium TAE3-ERU3]|nr:bifunctional DNA-formamidopyrimidine glycosylase/DNA-(apurinic or apyrimidinic site) lyase [Cardiobacteriaceae bacterium TAE3-ERU3]
MPELPEVETTRLGLTPLIADKTITDINIRQASLRRPVDQNALQQCKGLSFTKLERRAKYLMLHTSDAKRSLLIHLGMSGSLRVNNKNETIKKHDHILLELDKEYSLRFHDPRRFGQFEVIDPTQWPDYLLRLGPEPLEESFNGDYLFARSRKRKIAVKAFIMDQLIVVGVGNIYATEALFHSAVHPASVAGKVPRKAYQLLADEIKKVLVEAIRQGGTTLRDFLHSDGRGGYFQQTLSVYGKVGEACPKCNQKLESAVIGGRSSVYCSHCQRLYR